MIELKINVENEVIKEAFTNFILNYKVNISDYMNQLVANDGGPIDSDVTFKDGQITVHHIAPDKGFVLGETGNEELPIQIMQYANLEVDKRYILPEKDRLVLFLKEAIGVADYRLGAFKTLPDAMTGFNSEAVKVTMDKINDLKKAKKREEDRTKTRLERLSKQSEGEIEEAQVVENNEQ